MFKFFECPTSRIIQRDLIADAWGMWGRLLDKIEAAVLSEYQDTLPEIVTARNTIGAVFNYHADGLEAQWLTGTYRLLCQWAIPWPASAVPEEATSARALGEVFDAATLSRHAARPLADAWVMWSVKWIKIFGENWADLIRKPDAH